MTNPPERAPTRLSELPEHQLLTIESRFRKLKADQLDGKRLLSCYCEGLRTITGILHPDLATLDEPMIDGFVELTFEAANLVQLRLPDLLTRGFFAEIMEVNERLVEPWDMNKPE